MAGEKFNLNNNEAIKAINSPKISVNGPYSVVFKNIEERWAIVALDWNDKPHLAIRWFWSKAGNPTSTGHPTWFIIPSQLVYSTLNGLPLNFKYRKLLESFLNEQVDGNQLSKGSK